jgi:predicted nucleic acid-binding protein
MCSGFYQSREIREKEDFLTHISGSKSYKIQEVSLGIADEAGRIRASKDLRLPDAIIVATGLKEGAKYLATNDESFKKARDLISVFTPKELVKELEGVVRKGRK